jgi:polyferredoxin
MKMKTKKRSKIQIFRLISLAFFMILITVLSILHQISYPGVGPIDALCPFGGLETFYKFLAGGDFLTKIFTSNIVLLVGVIILGVLVGRYFCGWICMFGGLQEYIGILGKKLFKKRFTIPQKADKILRYLKYIVLVVVLVLTWKAGELIIRPYDPFVAFAHLSTGLVAVWSEFAVGLIILGVTLLASLFYDRVFCKYLCPMGAFLAILSKIGIYRIMREESTCTHCTLCDKKCPVNIDISKPSAITSAECINCLECVTVCPTKKETLYITIFGKKIRPIIVAIGGLLIYIAIIATSLITGYWKSADQSLEQKLELGLLSPDDIKGSNSLKEVADIFKLNLDELYDSLDITKELVPETTKLKDIKAITDNDEFEAEEVRAIVKNMLGIPIETNAVEKGSEVVIEEQKTIGIGDIETPNSGTGTVDFVNFPLEGTMSVTDVAKALNVSEMDIIKKLELKESIPLDKPLKDLKDEFGFTMPELKERMNR